jgi:hypothetical protein
MNSYLDPNRRMALRDEYPRTTSHGKVLNDVLDALDEVEKTIRKEERKNVGDELLELGSTLRILPDPSGLLGIALCDIASNLQAGEPVYRWKNFVDLPVEPSEELPRDETTEETRRLVEKVSEIIEEGWATWCCTHLDNQGRYFLAPRWKQYSVWMMVRSDGLLTHERGDALSGSWHRLLEDSMRLLDAHVPLGPDLDGISDPTEPPSWESLLQKETS